MQNAIEQTSTAWRGRLELDFARSNNKTVIARRSHVGPLTIQRPFYPEADVCHSYILHPPGGVVGGDELQLSVVVQTGAHALITTPASAKFYRSEGAIAKQQQTLHVADNAVLEYLPQDTILFDACRVETRTRIELSAGARFAGWEILCQGRPASGEKFHHGQCRQVYEMYRDGHPLVIERMHLQGNTLMQSAKWGLANYPVLGTMLVSDANAQMLELARKITVESAALFSASLLNGVLVCRYLGAQGMEARDCFARVWAAIRPAWIGREACRPRIWDT
ncbi:MAG: urease accessory protein UreD [Gammaproteobacteria bacterium]|nr:urease accessory protein UreD [Gammaproteobacteria bacterium]